MGPLNQSGRHIKIKYDIISAGGGKAASQMFMGTAALATVTACR